MDHVAIDLGGRESQICSRGSSGGISLEKRVATRDLREFFEGIEPSRIILETCAEAFAIAAHAKDAGHDVRVVPATLVRALGVGQRGIKTDQRDARCLSEASTRVDLVSVHIPSRPSREMKAACAMREATVEARTKLINNVRGWMRGELLRIRGGATETFPGRLRSHCSAIETELPTYVVRQLVAIESLTNEIEAANRELSALANDNADCRRLMTVPGVGPITAIRFLAAVDHAARFANPHVLESYFGLTPGESSSSDTKRRTSLTKAGAKKVRWVMIQAAWSVFRSRPNDPMVLWAKQIALRRGSRTAISALARKIAGIMFALLRDGSTYNPARGSTVRATDVQIIAQGATVVRDARRKSAKPAVESPASARKQVAASDSPAASSNVPAQHLGEPETDATRIGRSAKPRDARRRAVQKKKSPQPKPGRSDRAVGPRAGQAADGQPGQRSDGVVAKSIEGKKRAHGRPPRPPTSKGARR